MAHKPWNPRKLKNEIAEALANVHRLSCALAKESTAVIQNQGEAQYIDVELMREGAEDLKRWTDKLSLLWEIAAYPDDEEGVLFKSGLL